MLDLEHLAGALARRGFVVPEPHKRPKASYCCFEATLAYESWQMDITHIQLRNGRVLDVLNVIDDYSRLCVASKVLTVATSAAVVATFDEAAAQHGFPASVLSDNGAVFTASFRSARDRARDFRHHLNRLTGTFDQSRSVDVERVHPE